MDCEQEIKDLGNIVLGLAKNLQEHEKNIQTLGMLMTQNMETCLNLIENLKNAAEFQQVDIAEIKQKLIHMNWAIEELEKK